jgi:hypothetical protein
VNYLVDLRANPLVLRLIRRPVRMSSWRILLITICVALIVLALCTAAITSRYDLTITPGLLLLVAILMISTPPFVAYAASTLTLRELHSEQFELLHVTALSNARLIQGYIFAALYRARPFLLVIFGLMPTVLLGAMFYSGYVRCTYNFSGQLLTDCGSIPLPEDPALWLLTFLLIFVCFAGVVLLSAIFGVLLAVLFQIEWIANPGALMLTLIGTMVAALWVMGMSAQPLPIVLLRSGALLFGILVAGFLETHAARPFARKRV